MNKNTPPAKNPGSETITPWPRSGEIHPSVFISSAKNIWPGLPRLDAVTPHIQKADKKQIGAILGRYDDAIELRRVHDIPGCSQSIRDADRSAAGHDGSAVACEVSRRELAAMSPELFNKSVTDINASKVEAGAFAASLAERLSETLFDEFDVEALAAEQRFLKYGQPLENKIYHDQWLDIFTLHGDSVLGSLYCECWFLRHYFPGEFRSPKMINSSCCIQWLRDIAA